MKSLIIFTLIFYFSAFFVVVLQDCNVTSYFGCAAHLYFIFVYVFHEQYENNVLTFIFLAVFFLLCLAWFCSKISLPESSLKQQNFTRVTFLQRNSSNVRLLCQLLNLCSIHKVSESLYQNVNIACKVI